MVRGPQEEERTLSNHQQQAKEMVQLLRCRLEMSWDLQHPHKKPGPAAYTCSPSTGKAEIGGSGAHWPASLERLGLQKEGVK